MRHLNLLIVEDDIGQPNPFARHPHDLQSAEIVGIPRQKFVFPFLRPGREGKMTK